MSGEYSSLNQRLSKLTNLTTSQAILLLRRKQLLASSGNLPTEAVEEVVSLINSLSKLSVQNLQKQVPPVQSKPRNGDIVRLVQLQSTQSRHYIYAITISRDLLLVLVFDDGTRFSAIRRQAQLAVETLLAPEPETVYEYRTYPKEVKTQPAPKPVEPQKHAEAEMSEAASSEPESTKTHAEGGMNVECSTESRTESPIQEEDVYGYSDAAELIEQGPSNPTPEQAELSNSAQGGLEISSSHYIAYSCLLVPRMPQHLLTSNLASFLFTWMGQLCLAYGWRLEHLSIHSNHIQWIAGAPLTTSPAYLVRTLRHKTSSYIFSQFPPLSNSNPSGDFWAPGFYISGGKQSFQPQMIDRFINEIREQQGVFNHSIYQ